jgi:hypothetical protein
MNELSTLTEAELADFAQKLNGFASSLTQREQQFLQQILDDAAFAAGSDASGYADLMGVDDDVEGFAMGPEASLRSSLFAYGEGLARGEQEVADLAGIGS